MKRRSFVRGAGVGLAAGTAALLAACGRKEEPAKQEDAKKEAAVAAPAVAASGAGEIQWRMASSFPKSLDTLFGGAELIARRVAAATNNKFQIRVFAAGEIVPGLQVADAVQNGTVECGQTASYYYVGKDPTFALGTAVPFGLTYRQFNAWWLMGGADKLLNEFYGKYNIHALLAGNTGAQMGGWFRKEIKSVDDLKGLKFRIAGVAGQIVAKLGAVPTQVAGGEIYQALERGTIDAAEWVGPYDDEKLGLAKVARYYYYPGWWEGSAALHLFVNKDKWNSLPDDYKAVLEAACGEATVWMMAKYDSVNPEATKRLVASGAQLRAFPRPVMEACYKVWNELTAEMSAKNEDFKKAYEHMRAFQADQVAWFRVTENTFENFMSAVRR